MNDSEKILKEAQALKGELQRLNNLAPYEEESFHARLTELNKLRIRCEKLMKAETAPLNDELQKLKDKWVGVKLLKEAVADGRDKLSRVIKERVAREEAAKRAEEARLQALRESARPPMPPAPPSPNAPQAPLPPVPPVPPTPMGFVPAPVAVGIKYKTKTVAKITDWDKALAYFSGNEKVRELIQSLADKQAAAGIAGEGFEATETQIAVL